LSQFWKQQFTFGLVIFVCSFLLLAPKSALSATQNISFNCSANSFQAPSVPGDILVITLTAACKTQNTNYGTNVTLNSIVSSTGVSKTIATSTLYSVGDVFTYTVGTAVGTNTNAGFSNTAGSSYYGVYAATPSIPNVTAISPTSGSANGGTSVTITSSSSRSFQTLGTGGAWVSVVTDVTIGGVAVQSYSVTSDTTLTAVTPAGSVGTASVVVTNTVGSNSANTLYTYVEPPTATSNSPAAQNLTLTGAMTNITPLTGSGGTAPLTYYVSSGTLPSGISLNATTGVISGTPTATYSTANVVIAVKDANNIPASTTSSVSFTVAARPTRTASDTTSRTLAVGLPISSFTPITGTGGTAPLNYFISSGTLPSGLTLNSTTGLVSGTPTAIYSAASVVFGVKDANNITPSSSSTSSVSFTVNKGSQTISYTSSAPSSATVGGDTYTPVATSTSGLALTLTIDATSTTVCSITGGVVTLIGSGTCKINANQSGNVDYDAAAQVQQSFTVSARPTATASTTAQSLTAGTAMTSFTPLTGSGGVSPLTYYISSGTLPAGLSLSSSTGAVTGTPSGAFAASNIVFAVKDVNNSVATTTSTVSFTVNLVTPVISGFSLSSNNLVFGSSAPTITAPTSASSGAITYSSSNLGVATVSGSTITIVGVGTTTLTATQAANGNYDTANTTATLTITASTDANLSGLTLSSGALTPTFASSTFAYTQSVANAVSSITVTPTVNQANATVTVNGTAVTSGSASGSISLNVGTNTITTVVTAQDGTTTQTYTTTVTRAAALISQASFSVTASPNALNATTTTSALSTTGGSGTGSVTYAMSAGTCTLSGSTVTAGTANETCTVTATKAADSTYLAATATVNITVSRRASLASAATDPSVARMQAVQLAQSKLFVQNQIENVTSHLDNYRHSFKLMPSRMGITINTPSLGPMSPVFYKVKDAWAGNTALANDPSMQKIGMKDATPTTMGEKIYNDYVKHEPIDEQTHNEEAPAAYERTQGSYSLWSTGSVDTGLFKTGDNNDQSNKFRLNGLTFGLDYKLGPRAIMGAALGLSQGSSKAQELDGSVKSNQQSVKGYGLLGFGDGWVVDGLLGQSRHSFTGDRTTSGGAATLGMSRNGDSTFASSSIRKIVSYRSFRLALFVRQDITHIRLNPYNETGAADYALGYDKAKYTATATSAGLHLLSDFYLDRGKLTTSAKLSANRMRTSSISQDIYYADSGIAGGIYTLQQSSSQQNLPSLSLGISYTNKAGDGIDFGWIGAIGSNQNKLNGLRLGLRFAM
jgi:Autotransporter beta-domain/Cadherin-like beta sandwich domain/Putative Ig domain